ncbi:DUF4139 domain-containing protein [candidate division KSB1 bacterium]|nr:DUF4139 domain-containing protein [candidate division KSB1 bacterium]
MIRNLLRAAAALALATAALAAPGVSITIYNDNLSLVRDTRGMEFKAGRGELMFRDVSAQIDATSVHFRADGVDMLEQNFDYDLVSPDKLLQKYIDKEIEVVNEKGEIARGTLLSFGGMRGAGQLVLKQGDGSLRSLMLDKAADIRYPSLPEGLITRPTLRWLVDARSGGNKETEVSYLTSGLSWKANYVLVSNQENTRADMDAWVTITNSCGTSYTDAKLKLIAGEPNRVRDVMRRAYAADMMVESVGAKAAPQFQEQSFFEYHLYTLQRPASVMDNQIKQISLFPSAAFSTKKLFTYDSQVDNDRVTVSLEFENREENGLGIALPAGVVRVYQLGPDGSQEFIGEDRIEHTPRHETMRVTVGKAFDVVVEKNQQDYRQISSHSSETDWEVKLRNRKQDKIEVVVVDHFWGDWEIRQSSLPYKKVTATKVEFTVPCDADQETILTYTVRQW